jgi:beta-galactosidase/beta-glucuronidase
MSIKRQEYPRPQFVRDGWECLNGEWEFAYDDGDTGMRDGWFRGDTEFDRTIKVPFVYQAGESGIGDTSRHDVVWYARTLNVRSIADRISNSRKAEDNDVILHFGAVDYQTDIFVNGCRAMSHEGGDASFSCDITPYIRPEGGDRIVVRVYDPCDDEAIPRGKQIWGGEPCGIWYTPSTGIWQSVWLEAVPKRRIENILFTSAFDQGMERMEIRTEGVCDSSLHIQYEVTFHDQAVACGSALCTANPLILSVDVLQNHIFRSEFHNEEGWTWSPEHPNLFDVRLALVDEQEHVIDEVTSYFGFRKVSVQDGMIFLNNKPYYQRLVLDQGYWPEGLLTAPTDEALRFDIEAAKKCGFNGCRKHQKTEDPRFLYWADKLGYLVWEEWASTPSFGPEQVRRQLHTISEVVRRDYNHPSIIVWVPLNESWGVPKIHGDRTQQHYAQMLYHFLHSVDPTRLVVGNDGWEETETDICAVHNYSHGTSEEHNKFENFQRTFSTREELLSNPPGCWNIYAEGFHDHGQPVVLSEFGGIGYDVNSGEKHAWGYTNAKDSGEYVGEYTRILDVVAASPVLSGFCYTQLTDVEQEVNGILTYDRQWKCDPEDIRRATVQYRPERVRIPENTDCAQR